MKYGTIKGVEKPVSRLVFGCTISGPQTPVALATALNCGINTLDTAHVYPGSEAMLGEVLARHDRDSLVIATKGCHPTWWQKDRVNRKCLIVDLDTSLFRMKLDYIDILMLHRDSVKTPVDEIVETLNELHAQGKVKAFGGSNWTVERIKAANEYATQHGLITFAISSPHFGLAHQHKDPWGGGDGTVTLTGADMAGARAWYKEDQIAVFAFSSLAHGLMSGKVSTQEPRSAQKQLDRFARKGYCYPDNFERLRRVEQLAVERGCTVAQIALAWVFTQDLDVYAIFSSANPARIQSNVAAMEITLTPDEAAWLNLD